MASDEDVRRGPLEEHEELAAEPEQERAAPPPPSAPPVPAPRRLERSRDDRVVAGVCGGLGEYLGVDAVLLRIAALLLVFAGGAGIVLYLVGWVAMPEAAALRTAPGAAPVEPATADGRRSGSFVLGLVFVVLGVVFLVDRSLPDFLSWEYVWPLALIAVGAAILLRPRR